MDTLPTPTSSNATDSTGLLAELVGDGRPLLALVALGLILSGIFALFLSATGAFLPHDVAFLGMQPRELCALHECRIVHFIFHDRVSFGGTLIAIGTLYLWLLAFPLRLGEEWAWWTLLFSGVIGFLSFLAYLIYGRRLSRASAALYRRPGEDAPATATPNGRLAQPLSSRHAIGPQGACRCRTRLPALCRVRHDARRIGNYYPRLHDSLCAPGHRLSRILCRTAERDQPTPPASDRP
jgi:hypothetical protein